MQVGETEETLWIADARYGSDPVTVSDGTRTVVVAMSGIPIELGFDVRLVKFHRRLEPGSAMASKYSSTVDILDRETGKPLTLPDGREAEGIIIEMNRPIDVRDPKSGVVYRLYQESYREWTEQHGFYSTLAVNYDPGRGWKYAGSYMICIGMAMVFFMSRWFGRRKKAAAESS